MRRTPRPRLFTSPLRFLPRMEALESRETPAVFNVAAGDVASLIADMNTANGNGEPNTIDLAPGLYDFTAADNFWYGPNALPAVSSDLTFEGNGAVFQRSGSDPFRFFYVSGGFSGLAAGTLTLKNLELQGGLAQGGNGGIGQDGGGGGLGAGGAIYNQGALGLDGVTLSGNTAKGGNGGDGTSVPGGGGGGGGMFGNGGNAAGASGGGGGGMQFSGSAGSGTGGGAGGGFAPGGFTATVRGGTGSDSSPGVGGSSGGIGGDGAAGTSNSGGGGGGFRIGDNAAGIEGGGLAASGGQSGGATTNDGGDSLGTGSGSGGGGGAFGGGGGGGGSGGFRRGGGGGVGGGAGAGGGGGLSSAGGFGGGGTRFGQGGFGAGGGAIQISRFGGGSGGNSGVTGAGGGGAGLGGAIFNHFGSVTISDSTFTGNSALGGVGGNHPNAAGGGQGGAGFGGAIFNFDGSSFSIVNATIAGNTVASGANGTNSTSGAAARDGGAVYTLAFGNSLAGGTVTADVSFSNSILATSIGGNDLAAQQSNGSATNTATVDLTANNLIMTQNGAGGATFVGTPVSTADPLLGVLQSNGGLTRTMALLTGSPAINTGDNAASTGSPEQRGSGFNRIIDSTIDLGAYEYQPPATVTSVASSLNPSIVGDSITFTATVAGIAAGSNAPLGSVSFSIDSGAAQVVALDSAGQAMLTTSALTTGTHTVAVVYAGSTVGDYSFDASAGSLSPVQTVNQSPAITSGSSTTYTVGSAGTFTIISTGFPTASLSKSGALPRALTFTDNGDGTATLAGTPDAATGGVFSFTITAANGVGTDATQTFTLTVNEAPTITSANTATFVVGIPRSFTILSAGFPVAALSEAGALPSGITLIDNGDGTATLAGTPAAGSAGTYAIAINASNGVSPDAVQNFTITVSTQPSLFAVGADAGGGPRVVVYNADGTTRFSFYAFDPAFLGGVHMATGDVTGDGVPEIIVAAGAGGGPHVKVFDGATGSFLRGFFAYDAAFSGGVFVAAGDVDGDGLADIITGAGAGGGPNVRVFRATDGGLLRSFFAYAPDFAGGVRVAAGDVNGDGHADIITGAGVGGAAHLEVFDAQTNAVLLSRLAFDNFFGGIYVAAGDMDGDGIAEVAVSQGVGGRLVRILNADGSPHGEIDPFPVAANVLGVGGVRIALIDRSGNGHAEVAAIPGPLLPSQLSFFNGDTLQPTDSFMAFEFRFVGGAFVG